MSEINPSLLSALADRYRIDRELGAGGMATVYLAHDVKHNRLVAVKVLRPELAATVGPDRFLREIEVAARLTHPHILPVHDSGEAGGFLFYVMPYIDGESLRDRLVRDGSLPIDDVVRIAREVVDALASAHRMGVVHRDIKPDNVLLSQNHALVADFGVAKAVSEASDLTKLTTAGVALGTPVYMAPEQGAADPNIDHRADIYAVGVLAYEMLAGEPPFTGHTAQAILGAHLTDPPQPITERRATVPPALATIVMRCLEKERADRWQSAGDMLQQLEALSTPSGGVTPTGSLPVSSGAVSPRRRPLLIGGGALAAVLAVLAVTTFGGDTGEATLIEGLVLVAPFENQTTDPSLDHVGKVLADWLARGIEATGLAEVVDPQTAVAGAAGDGTPGNPRTLAASLGAGTMITGTYFRRGDSVQIQANLVASESGNLIAGADPVMAPVTDPLAASDVLADRVLGAVANRFGRLSYALEAARTPRSYEAYQEFVTALEVGRLGSWADARPGLQRALEIDSTFYPAAIYLALVYATAGPLPGLDTLVQWLSPKRDQLSEFERLWLDHYEAFADGDLSRSYRAHRSLSALRPNDPLQNHMYGQYALRTGRVQEAVEVLTRPHRLEYSPLYWGNVTAALHLLGEHESELEMALAARAAVPDNRATLLTHVRALVALDRLTDLRAMANEIVNFPDPLSGVAFTVAATELRVHGHLSAAEEFIERSVEWFERRIEADPDDIQLRHNFVHALIERHDWDAAAEQAQRAAEVSQNEILSTELLGLTGIALARDGRRAEAEAMAQRLASLDGRYLRGQHTYYRGLIAANLGDREGSVDLLIESHRQGRTYALWVHTAVSVDSLRLSPRFVEFARPK